MLHSLMSRLVRTGELTITYPSGKTIRYGDGTKPAADILVRDHRTLIAVATHPMLKLGEAYMDGGLQVTRGSIADVLEILMKNLGTAALSGPSSLLMGLRRLARRAQQFNPARRSRRNVAHHYDLPPALYDLFLDADRQYSCAYFTDLQMSLDEAQHAKKRHIIAKLALETGQEVLDIGCGWGGLGLSLCEAGAAKVLGVTLSSEQLAIARERAKAAGLEARVSFAMQDYRALQGQFDRIVSVGMFEHVGIGHYDEYFRSVARLLKPKGVAMIHTIGRSDGPGVTNPWIAKYIFPGGYTPALSEMLPAIERAGLQVCDVETLRLHYAMTLKHWRMRFCARWDEARAMLDERFCRMWEFYLAGSEMGFRHQGLVVFQLLLARDIEALPLTRDYMFDAERALALVPPQTQPGGRIAA